MVILTVAICITPTVAYWLTKKYSRAVRIIVETFLFVALILIFSVWLCGTHIDFWILPTTILILLWEVGSHLVEYYKVSTLNRLANEVTFKRLKNQAEDIEKMFRIGLVLYIPVPLSLIIGNIAGWLSNQTPKEIIFSSLKLVILLISLFLIIFLYVGIVRMCDPLFEDSDAPSSNLEKEQSFIVRMLFKFDIVRMLLKLHRLVTLPQSRKKSEKEAIELACTVSNLRKIYLYDAIDNVISLIALVAFYGWLSEAEINPKWLISSLVGIIFFLIYYPTQLGKQHSIKKF